MHFSRLFHLKTLKCLKGKPVWLLIISVGPRAPDVIKMHASFHEVQKYELVFSHVTTTAFPPEGGMRCVHAVVFGTKPKNPLIVGGNLMRSTIL